MTPDLPNILREQSHVDPQEFTFGITYDGHLWSVDQTTTPGWGVEFPSRKGEPVLVTFTFGTYSQEIECPLDEIPKTFDALAAAWAALERVLSPIRLGTGTMGVPNSAP